MSAARAAVLGGATAGFLFVIGAVLAYAAGESGLYLDERGAIAVSLAAVLLIQAGIGYARAAYRAVRSARAVKP